MTDAGVLEDDDQTHLIGPDMRLGEVVKESRLALHVWDIGSEDRP
ncbi:hypothetical protein AB0K21_02275 [Streptosporangium sp. NPDC049248]